MQGVSVHDHHCITKGLTIVPVSPAMADEVGHKVDEVGEGCSPQTNSQIRRAPAGPLAGAPGLDSPGAALARRPLLDGDGPDHPGRLMRGTEVLVGPGRVERMGEAPTRLNITGIPCLSASRQRRIGWI